MSDEISDILGQNEPYTFECKAFEVSDSIVLIPDVSTTEFSKYMGAFHSYGNAINLGSEHVCVFAYPFMGHGRVCFQPANEFYNNDPFYFLLMTVEREDSIKKAIKMNSVIPQDTKVKFQIQPVKSEEDFGDI